MFWAKTDHALRGGAREGGAGCADHRVEVGAPPDRASARHYTSTERLASPKSKSRVRIYSRWVAGSVGMPVTSNVPVRAGWSTGTRGRGAVGWRRAAQNFSRVLFLGAQPLANTT